QEHPRAEHRASTPPRWALSRPCCLTSQGTFNATGNLAGYPETVNYSAALRGGGRLEFAASTRSAPMRIADEISAAIRSAVAWTGSGAKCAYRAVVCT